MTRVQECLAAYEHTLKIYQMNNDNYFKRTQILMIVAQSVLFVTFVKLFSGAAPTSFSDPLTAKRIALLAIAFLGVIAASTWWFFIHRQGNVLNLCKTYLRGIEDALMRLGVPSGYWTYESMVSNSGSYTPRELGILHKAKWLFPPWLFKWENKELKIGLTKI